MACSMAHPSLPARGNVSKLKHFQLGRIAPSQEILTDFDISFVDFELEFFSSRFIN